MKVKKGDRLVYTGPYAPEVIASGAVYPPGTVVAFRDHKTKVTVLLDKREGETEDLYADWPIEEVVPA